MKDLMVRYPSKDTEATKGFICRENVPSLFLKILFRQASGEAHQTDMERECSAKVEFCFTEFAEIR